MFAADSKQLREPCKREVGLQIVVGSVDKRLHTCHNIVLCSIIGLSLVNSIFVDAMVSDNNDELERQVKELNEKIDKLLSDKDM